MKLMLMIILVVGGFFAYQEYEKDNKRALADSKIRTEESRVWRGVVDACERMMVANTGAHVLDWDGPLPSPKKTSTGYKVSLYATTKAGHLSGECFTDNAFRVINVKYASRGVEIPPLILPPLIY